MGLLGGSGGKDKDEGAMDKAKGRMKEGAGALTGDKKAKREGRSANFVLRGFPEVRKNYSKNTQFG